MAVKNARRSKRIYIVDDHAVVREGLGWIVAQEDGLEVCGEAEDASHAIEKIQTLKPDLVIIDVALNGMSGLDLCKKVRALLPEIRILILSMYKEELYAERALRSGANGYVMKRDGGKKLLLAIRRVLSGQTYVSEEFNETLLQKLGAGNKEKYSMDALTNRELDVLRLIGQGFSSRQIATELGISVKTVEAHREHMRAKLNLGTNPELVQHAIHWVHSENIS